MASNPPLEVTQSAAASKRDPWIDNGRFVAACLVVAMHMIELHMRPESGSEWFWMVTWGFRLPLFGIIAGLFSRERPVEGDFTALTRLVLLPLVLMTAVHLALDGVIGREVVLRPSEPVYTLWFLYGLIFWRVSLPYVARLRRPLLWVTLAAIVVGLPPFFSQDWALALIIGHFPFLVLGWKLKPHLHRLRGRTALSTVLAMGVIIAAAVGLLALRWNSHFGIAELSMGIAYADRPFPYWLSMLNRLLVLAIGVLVALSMLHLVPRRHLPWVSVAGSNGFTIYLLHGVVIRVARELGVFPVANLADWQVPVLIGVSFLLGFLLGSRTVARIFRPVLRPRARWLLR